MPIAPELSPKQKRSTSPETHWQPMFEGDINPQEWMNNWQERQKREAGFFQRLGNVAAAKLVQRDKGKQSAARRKAAKYRDIAGQKQAMYNKYANSTEAIPQTDLRKMDKSRARRIGAAISRAANRSNKNQAEYYKNASVKSAEHSNKMRSKPGRLQRWARDKTQKAKYDQHKSKVDARNAYEEARYQAYVDQQRFKARYEREQSADSIDAAMAKAKRVQEVFERGGARQLARSVPAEKEVQGDYIGFAAYTMNRAAENRRSDGSIPLLNERTVENMSMGQEKSNVDNRTDYVGGVATSIWEMGFVDFGAADASRASNLSQMNPDIQWERGQDSVSASIPFDPENELHQIVAEGQRVSEGSMIRLSMMHDSESDAREMSVSLVNMPQQMSPEPAPAAPVSPAAAPQPAAQPTAQRWDVR